MNERQKYFDLTTLPSNFLAEQAVLSILLVNPLLLQETIFKVKKENFAFEDHRILYENMVILFEKNFSLSLTSLITTLQDKGLLKKIGGIEKITKLLNSPENPSELDFLIQQLNEKYLRRTLIEVGKQIITWGYNTSEEIERILEKIEEKLFELTEENISEKIYSSSEIIEDVFSEMKAKINKNETAGFQSSFNDLDAILQGFQKSDLIIIAGRPSMGKTAFSLSLGKNIVTRYNIPLIIFSLEMSRQQIIYRFLADEANINSSRLKSGKMTQIEWKKLSQAMKKISDLPIYIDDNPKISILDIRNKLKKILLNKKKTGLVIIDYLQLMKLNLKLENRVQEISYITRNLKILAKEFQIPILLLSQLSRNVESRINKRPLLSDLRESGCLAKNEILTISKQNSFIWNKTNCYKLNNQEQSSFKGIKPIFFLTFKNKLTIKLTANHKILSKEGWIRIEELKKETQILFLKKKNNRDNNLSDFNTNLDNSYHLNYSTLKKIEYKGLERVYDTMIPIFHNYILNNIICHNSIEQDADIVIMLYREEYYNEKSLQPHLTEFIVSKHRNGPIGTAKLIFYPVTTSFKNE
jgi:replicative DNA helicase